MANIAFGSKYFIFSKFSSIPKTSKIEQERANLIQEFNDLNNFIKSEELADFNTLESYLNSSEAKELSASLQEKKKKEQDKIKSYESQKKSKKIKDYFKLKNAQKLKDYNTFSDSKELARYEELKEITSSSNLSTTRKNLEIEIKKAAVEEKQLSKLAKNKSVKRYLTAKNNSDDKQEITTEVKQYLILHEKVGSADFKEKKLSNEKELNNIINQEKEFKQLAKSKQIKFYFNFSDSRKFKNFEVFEKSKELADYIDLDKYLASGEHKETLKSIEEKEIAETDKKKKYEDFKNSKKYKWYVLVKDSNKFDDLKNWKLTFEDDFTTGELNSEKWMTRYLWGDKLINDGYALEVDKAFPTDGKNIECTNNSLRIVTRKEYIAGKVWKQPFGFIPQDFDFTTGLINTAKSFRQKYGKFEAKIKVNYAKPVNYNFWMASEKNLPHVDILKLDKKKTKVESAHHTGDLSDKGPNSIKSEFSGLDVAQDYFIYSFLWTPDKLVWKINDVIVNEQKKNIPQEEMYLVFSSSMTGKADGNGLPASLEIDWVRCYKEV